MCRIKSNLILKMMYKYMERPIKITNNFIIYSNIAKLNNILLHETSTKKFINVNELFNNINKYY